VVSNEAIIFLMIIQSYDRMIKLSRQITLFLYLTFDETASDLPYILFPQPEFGLISELGRKACSFFLSFQMHQAGRILMYATASKTD
jgi:hypothetical protein